MKKAKLNYWIDVSIGISFVLSAISGLIFLAPVGSGSGILGISYALWDTLHTWSSLAMIVGVLAHLVLHWKWIVGMTGKMLLPARNPQESKTPVSGNKMPQGVISRRQFLSLGLVAALAGVIAASCSMFTGNRSTDTQQEANEIGLSQDDSEPGFRQQETDSLPSDELEQPLEQGDADPPEEEQPVQLGGVACPRGMVNDPYPGRCRNYTDNNGDGICDYSVPGSGSN